MDTVSKTTWEEFQKRCALQHSHMSNVIDKLTAHVERLAVINTKLEESVSGHTWFRQMLTALIMLLLGLMFPAGAATFLKIFGGIH